MAAFVDITNRCGLRTKACQRCQLNKSELELYDLLQSL